MLITAGHSEHNHVTQRKAIDLITGVKNLKELSTLLGNERQGKHTAIADHDKAISIEIDQQYLNSVKTKCKFLQNKIYSCVGWPLSLFMVSSDMNSEF